MWWEEEDIFERRIDLSDFWEGCGGKNILSVEVNFQAGDLYWSSDGRIKVGLTGAFISF